MYFCLRSGRNRRSCIGRCLFFVLALCFAGFNASANDLRMTNGSISSINESVALATVKFDISWENSWRDNLNYDAVWIFMKYSTDSGDTWRHAKMSTSGTNPAGFSSGEGTGAEIIVPSDKSGCFIQRASNGEGSLSVENINIVWNYGDDGLDENDIEDVDIKIFGIEMVYIPEGAFYAGDNETSTASLDQGSAFSETDPWYIQSSAAISVEDIGANGYYYNSGGNPSEDVSGSEFIITNSFPKGYKAFYMMKTEITEQQWVDFFNTLTDSEKTNRDITDVNGKNSDSAVHRNTVSWAAGEAVTSRRDRACAYISWPDLCAYADWASLRPMTELEFEKAARGKDIVASNGEYAWGDTGIQAATSLSGTEDGTETVTNSGANCCYGNNIFSGGDGGSGPLRAGIFAKSTTTRRLSGAGYYGVLDMSGNVSERCVTIGNSSGRSFLGTNGDGHLEDSAGFEGNATNVDWPGFVEGQGVVGSSGSGFRGGAWNETTPGIMSVSDRSSAAFSSNARYSYSGGRCVRTVTE